MWARPAVRRGGCRSWAAFVTTIRMASAAGRAGPLIAAARRVRGEPGRGSGRLNGMDTVTPLARLRRLVAAAGLAVLVAVAATGCAAPSPAKSVSSGEVTGTVRTSPGCPGPVRLGSPCPDRPLADARVDAVQGGKVVSSTVTDASGHYTLELAAGRYQIVVVSTAYPARAAGTAEIPPSATVDLTLDSGMR